MRKLLNFSTILFSYVLITVLVISCGGSSGGGGGTGGNGGGSVPQPEPKDDCLLADRPDKDSWMAILCYDGVVMAEIAKTAGTEAIDFLIPSTERTEGNTTRAWDLSKAREIQISYDKDYTLTVDEPTEGASQLGTLADAAEHTAEFPLQNLTISSFLNDNKDALRSGGITFMPTSGSAIKVFIRAKLAVKTQADFISMGNFTVSPLGESSSKALFYRLDNDLALVASGGEDAKFGDSIIPVADAVFYFDGGHHTITLRSEIDTTADDKPAAIIGKVTKGMDFRNVTVNINAPISGTRNVGTIVGHTESGANSKIDNSKININRNITLYKSADNADGYVGGVAGSGYISMNSLVVKTGDGAVIQVFVQNNAEASFSSAVGGLTGKIDSVDGIAARNNVVYVTLGVETSGDSFVGYDVSLGGLTGASYGVKYFAYRVVDNLVKLAISRGKLPADFAFNEVGGLSSNSDPLQEFSNNLVYADFSNLGKVKVLGGLIGKMKSDEANILDNMLFIADGFTGSEVQESFGVAIANLVSGGSATQFNDNFFSSPVTDYDTNENLASLVYTAETDINFNNLILDNKTNTIMFKAGNEVANLQGKVGVTNGSPLFTLAEAKTDDISTLFSDGNTNWEAVSGGYPQLKTPTYPTYLYSFFNKSDIEQAWTETNEDIQTELAARANK